MQENNMMNDTRYKNAEQLIYTAFFALIQKKDFDSISITELTRAANINRSTFYAHYVDKSALLEAVINKSIDEYFQMGDIAKQPFGEELIWGVLIHLREYARAVSKTYGRNFLSIIMQLERYLTLYIRDFIGKKLNESDYAKENPERHFLAVCLGASIFAIVRECQINESEVADKKDTILPLIFK